MSPMMEAMPFGSLWLPVVVSAVAVFIASSILHMVIKHHKADYKKLSNDDAVREVLGKGNPAPGIYMTPACGDMKDMRAPAWWRSSRRGPSRS